MGLRRHSMGFFIATFLFLGLGTSAHAGTPGSMISVDVGRFIYSLASQGNTVLVPLEIETAPLDWLSIYAAPRLAVTQGATAIGLGVGARLYVIGSAIQGLWLGPEFGVAYALATPSGVTASATRLSIGGAIGYNLLIGDSLVLSPGVNLGLDDFTTANPAFTWSPRIVVGYAF